MENLRPGQIVQTKEFWVLWLTFFMNTLPIGYINSMYKVRHRPHSIFIRNPHGLFLIQAYGQTFIRDDHFLATVGAFAAVFNASGRIFWGHLCDKFGYRTCMVFVTIAIAVLYITFRFLKIGSNVLSNQYLFYGNFFPAQRQTEENSCLRHGCGPYFSAFALILYFCPLQPHKRSGRGDILSPSDYQDVRQYYKVLIKTFQVLGQKLWFSHDRPGRGRSRFIQTFSQIKYVDLNKKATSFQFSSCPSDGIFESHPWVAWNVSHHRWILNHVRNYEPQVFSEESVTPVYSCQA